MKMESKPPITQGLQHIPTEPPAWAQTAGRAIHHLMNDFGGGRRCLKLAWVINFQKLATIPLLSIFMFKYKTSALRPGFMPQCTAVTDWYGSLRSSRLSRSQFSKACYGWSRNRNLPQRIGLVLGIRLAADLRHRYAKIPASRLRLVQFMHKPLHTGMRDHDRFRCAEVFHTPIQT